MTDAVRTALLKIRDSDEPWKAVASLINDIAAEFKSVADGLDKASWGSDNNVIIYSSVNDALQRMALDLDENGSVTP